MGYIVSTITILKCRKDRLLSIVNIDIVINKTERGDYILLNIYKILHETLNSGPYFNVFYKILGRISFLFFFELRTHQRPKKKQ